MFSIFGNIFRRSPILTQEFSGFLRKALTTAKLPLPQLESLPTVLIEIARQTAITTGTWNPVEIYTPDNTRSEKIRFIEAFNTNHIYNPHFIYSYAESFSYSDSKKTLSELLSQVKSFISHTRMERLARIALYFKIKDDLATCELVEGIQSKNEEKIRKALQQKYTGLNQTLLDFAKEDFTSRVASNPVKRTEQKGLLTQQELEFLQSQEFRAEQIKDAFIWALKQYGIFRIGDKATSFAVVIDEKVTGIDVRDKSINGPTIFIPNDSKVTGTSLIKLIGHEIEGHARQSINGEKLFLIGGGALKIDDEMLYEGLAKRYDDMLSQKLFGNNGGVPLPYYAYAINAARRGKSFFDIFQEQLDMRLYISLKKSLYESLPRLTEIEERIASNAMNQAWITTYRVMRGHIDTTNSRGFAMEKDLAYLQGYIIDKQLVEKDLGFVNEAAITQSRGIQLMAEFAFGEDSLPLKYQDVATKYWEEVLKPQLYTSVKLY